MGSHDELWIQLQPSVPNHPVVTDVLITAHNTTGTTSLAFIEVKRTSLATHLYLKTDETAQPLRKAQILLQGCINDHQPPFILTNSVERSFGLVQKCGANHIKIVDCFDVHIPVTPEVANVKDLVSLLRQVLNRKWVLAATSTTEVGPSSDKHTPLHD